MGMYLSGMSRPLACQVFCHYFSVKFIMDLRCSIPKVLCLLSRGGRCRQISTRVKCMERYRGVSVGRVVAVISPRGVSMVFLRYRKTFLRMHLCNLYEQLLHGYHPCLPYSVSGIFLVSYKKICLKYPISSNKRCYVSCNPKD